MTKLLLIKLPEPVGPDMKKTYMPPLGLWHIRETAQAAHVYCKVVDMHMDEPLPFNEDYDTIGISAQFSIQDRWYHKVVNICKAAWPTAEIIAGGAHAAAVPRPYNVDSVVRGAGEQALFPHVAPRKAKPSLQEMTAYWSMGAPHDMTTATGRWMPFETSRGCGSSCGFCVVKKYWGNWIEASIDGMHDNLDYLVNRLGIQELLIEDDNMGWNADHFRETMSLFEHFKLKWSTPNGIEICDVVQHLGRMAESGCWRVSLPFETGSYETSKLMGINGKWRKFEDAKTIVESIKGRGIKTCGFFVIGYPGETMEDMRKTLQYANALPLDDRHIYIATPYPGTSLYEICQRCGYLDYQPPELYDRLLYTEGVITTSSWSSADVTKLRQADRDQAIRRRNGT